MPAVSLSGFWSLYMMKEITNATPTAIAISITYCTGCSRQSRIPNIPVTPVPFAPRWTRDAYRAPHPPPIQPAIKGLKNLRFTPKIAGSVIPINALREDGRASDLIFLSLDLSATARAAAPWATFAALASGSQYVTPYCAICPISIAVYI